MAHSREIVEDELKSVQHHATAKAATVAQKVGVVIVGDVRVSFQAREESKLQKAEAAAQQAINVLKRQKDLEHKMDLGRLKKSWDILKIMN